MPVSIALAPNNVDSSAAESQNGNGVSYIAVQGSAMNNWKLKAFAGGGTEITAGAYPACVTTDVVQLSITAGKLW